MRNTPGVPIIFFDQNMLLIDKPSKASLEASDRRESLKEKPKKEESKKLSEKSEDIRQFLIEEYKSNAMYKRKMEELKIEVRILVLDYVNVLELLNY